MSPKVAGDVVTPLDTLSVIGRPTPAKVTRVDTPIDTRVSEALMDAARGVFGKIEVAAAHVEKDRGNFTRDLNKLAVLMAGLGPDYCALAGALLTKAFGPADPRAKQRERLVELIDLLLREIA